MGRLCWSGCSVKPIDRASKGSAQRDAVVVKVRAAQSQWLRLAGRSLAAGRPLFAQPQVGGANGRPEDSRRWLDTQ